MRAGRRTNTSRGARGKVFKHVTSLLFEYRSFREAPSASYRRYTAGYNRKGMYTNPDSNRKEGRRKKKQTSPRRYRAPHRTARKAAAAAAWQTHSHSKKKKDERVRPATGPVPRNSSAVVAYASMVRNDAGESPPSAQYRCRRRHSYSASVSSSTTNRQSRAASIRRSSLAISAAPSTPPMAAK